MDEDIEINFHKILPDGIYYCVKSTDKQTKEKRTEWKKSDELMCTNAIFEYWKSPHQFSDEISIEDNSINSNSNMKERLKILGITSVDDQLVFLVRFPNSDRDRLVKSKDLIQDYANEVIDFYRSHVKII